MRVDRHGHNFGNRVGTKQTRNPPPPKGKSAAVLPSAKGNEIASKGQEKSYETPQYSKNREHTSGRNVQRGRDLFPGRSEGQWRPKQIMDSITQARSAEPQPIPGQKETGNQNLEQTENINHQGLTKEAVMEQLHEVTRQYLSCPDPVEAAARRQRVLYSDANGLMEETAASIMASTPNHARVIRQTTLESNPATPPPLQDAMGRSLLLPVLDSPGNRTETPLEPADINVGAPPITDPQETETERPIRLRSVVISPSNEDRERRQISESLLPLVEENETLLNYQNKVRRKVKRTNRRTPTRSTPNILRGASSKKRKLSQIQQSPRESSSTGKASPRTRKAARKETNDIGTSNDAQNPPIRLIPAINRKKPDFRLIPHQAP